MIPRRGLTLVELLLALAMVASLAVVGVDWAVTASRLSGTAADTARWNAAARATLDCLAVDLTTGDFPTEARSNQRRVWIESGRVSILGRDHGQTARIIYGLDHATGTLRRWPGGAPGSGRVLLSEVTAFTCETEPVLDPDNPEAEPTVAIMTLTLARDNEHRIARKLMVPAEWLP